MHPYDEIIHKLTDKPWHSWPAHYDERRQSFFWGSDFLGHVRKSHPDELRIEGCCDSWHSDTPEESIRQMVQHYLDNHMRHEKYDRVL